MTSAKDQQSGLFREDLPRPEDRPARDRYFDVLRAAAIIRIVVYHMFPVAWLSMIFPSMGIMFALGGSLMAKSVERSAEDAILGRLRRLLPALWLFGAVLLPLMFWAGWPDRPRWLTFLLWLMPVVEPPSSAWAASVTGILWYLVAYLWLVLLSPLLLRMYKRARLATVAGPFVLLAVWDNLPIPFGEGLTSAVTDVLTFAACWVVGFAHRAGDLRRVRLSVLLGVALVAVGTGLAWVLAYPGDEGVDLTDNALAYGLYSLGFTLVLLRVSPATGWINNRRAVNGLVNFCNARAVTIYLWHNVAIALCFQAGRVIPIERVGPNFEMATYFGVALVLLAGFVAVLGWVEDLSARRPVSILPWTTVPASRPRPPKPKWAGPIWFE